MPDPSIDQKIETLYGAVDWSRASGCLHVAAIHGPTGSVIALGPDAPRSTADRFVLGFARARARMIVTTGAILRAEPDLEHRYAEDEESEALFGEWRRRVLGEDDPPEVLVLTGTGVLDSAHPALTRAKGILYTSRAGAERLGSAPDGFEVFVGASGGGAVQEAARFATLRAGSGSLLIEAGPTTSRSLYPDVTGESGVDELLLSSFEGELSPGAIGPLFIEAERIERRFGAPVSSVVIEEPSGRWRFERYVSGR